MYFWEVYNVSMPDSIHSLELEQNRGGGEIQRFIHKKNYNTNDNLILQKILNLEYFFLIFKKFLKNKKKRKDVNEFELNFFENIENIYLDFQNKRYKHGKYFEFKVTDTKTRIIHKASVRDRVAHRLLYDILYDYFDNKFIYDSYSSRVYKGIHKAVERYDLFSRKITKNYTKQAWALKFDIKKCFASIDRDILFKILEKNILDKEILNLCKEIIDSHKSGLPLGNLTSQLFINVYLHELDFYAKQKLKIKYYIRYADDIICLFDNKELVEQGLRDMRNFCLDTLSLKTHKEYIETIYSGVDFLGFVHFKGYKILRKTTQKRLFRNISNKNVDSYMGLLKHANTEKIRAIISL